MVDHQALAAAFKEYSNILVEPYEIGDMLYRLTDQVMQVLGVDGAGVTVADDDNESLGFVAATDSGIVAVEAQQEQGVSGPCQDAYTSGAVVAVADLDADERWPDYRSVALAQGCRAVAGLPMPSRHRRIGALNMYMHAPHEWDEEELDIAQLLANMASGYVLHHAQLGESRTVVGQLQKALDSRVVIEQAKGVLAERLEITPEEAFTLLRSQARSTGTRLHDLSRQVVDGTADLAAELD